MTYHIRQDNYTCPKCTKIYLPYKVDLPCPHCGSINEITDPQYLNSIEQILNSMRAHKIQYGSYTPGAWSMGTLIGYLQSDAFNLFDYLEMKKPQDADTAFKGYVEDYYSKQGLTEKNHWVAIMLEVYAEYKKNPPKSGGPTSWWRGIMRFLP